MMNLQSLIGVQHSPNPPRIYASDSLSLGQTRRNEVYKDCLTSVIQMRGDCPL